MPRVLQLAAGHAGAAPDAAPAPQTPLSPSSPDGAESSFAGTSFEDVVLQNSSDFYRWLSELEAARSSETEEKFRRYGASLERHLATADGLLATVKQVGAGGWWIASLASTRCARGTEGPSGTASSLQQGGAGSWPLVLPLPPACAAWAPLPGRRSPALCIPAPCPGAGPV